MRYERVAFRILVGLLIVALFVSFLIFQRLEDIVDNDLFHIANLSSQHEHDKVNDPSLLEVRLCELYK